MVLNPEDSQVDGGSDSLTRMLEWHRDFIERSYGLLRFVREELSQRHGFRGLTYQTFVRNGFGLNSSQGIQSFLATVLVPDVPLVASKLTSAAPIPKEGIRALIVQLRWLDKVQGSPVIWIVSLRARVESDSPADFNNYYLKVIPELEPINAASDRHRRIREIIITDKKYPTLHASGTYFERPLADLHDERDVATLVLAPALERWNAENRTS